MEDQRIYEYEVAKSADDFEKWIDFFHHELMKASKIPFDKMRKGEKSPEEIRKERIEKLKKIYGTT